MKFLKQALYATMICMGMTLLAWNTPAYAEPETKKVCNVTKDPKTQKSKEVCKTIKVHKKLDGTAIPDKKAK